MDFKNMWKFDEKMDIMKLQSTGLKVGVLLHDPWAYPCGIKATDKPISCTYPGIGIEYTRRLCHRLQILCDFVLLNATGLIASTKGEEIRQQLEDEEVQSGIVAKIVLGNSAEEDTQIDTFLPTLVETSKKRQLVSFTIPMFYMEGGVLIKTQWDSYYDMFFVARPFSVDVWIVLLVTLIFAVMFDMTCRFILEPNVWPLPRKVDTKGMFLSNFGILIQRGVNLHVWQWARRVMYGTLAICSIVICGMYSAFLVSQTVAVNKILPFKDLESLVEAVKYQNYKLLIDKQSSYFITQVKSSPLPLFQELDNMFKTKPPELVDNITEAVEKILTSQENLVLYSSLYTLNAGAKMNCNLTVIPLDGFADRGAYAFQKPHRDKYGNERGNYAHLFNKLTLVFNKDLANFLEVAEKKYRYGRNCDQAHSIKDVRVKMKYLEGIFYLGGLGLMFATSLFLGEIVWSGREKQPAVHALALQSLTAIKITAQSAVVIKPKKSEIIWKKVSEFGQFPSIYTYEENDAKNPMHEKE